jgi:hypothetical protein
MLTRDHQVVIDVKYVMEEYVSMLLKNKDEFVESPSSVLHRRRFHFFRKVLIFSAYIPPVFEMSAHCYT